MAATASPSAAAAAAFVRSSTASAVDDWARTRAKRPCEGGDAACMSAEKAPADSPHSVTRLRSPPKAGALARAQTSAARWSSRP